MEKKTEKEEKYKVTILDRRTIVTYPKLKTPAKTIAVTYTTDEIPPRTLFIPEEIWSRETEIKKIKEDIKKAKETKPETIEV